MKIIFLGSPEIALDLFEAVSSHHEIVAVITQSDKALGRSKKLCPTPIALAAEAKGLKVYKVEKIGPELVEELKAFNADLFLTFAFGLILKKDFFTVTRLGGINVHPSMLPELRGPSPIQSAILNGLTRSGITIQQVALKVDSGNLLFQKEFDILPSDNTQTIEDLVRKLASEIIVPLLADIEADRALPSPQDEEKATYCRMIKKEDGLINWDEPTVNIINKIRAFVNWPHAYTFLEGKRLSIFSAKITPEELLDPAFDSLENGTVAAANKRQGIIVKTGDSYISLESLQLAGKKLLGYKDFMNGFRDLENKIFTMENN